MSRAFFTVLVLTAASFGVRALSSQAPQPADLVDARRFGATGDGQASADCSVTGGSSALTCQSDHFSPADEGKVIAIYDAGPDVKGFTTTLSTSVRAVVSPRSVTLAAPAATTASPSSRTVWGADDTRALQAALDALTTPDAGGRNRGGILSIPPGLYLVSGLDLPCARLGRFIAGACTATYNDIWIRGAGRDLTILENWDADSPRQGVLALGARAEVPFTEPGNDRLSNITVSDLTLRQLKNPVKPLVALWSAATADVLISNTAGSGHSYECYIMGGGVKSVRWRVHDNVMGPCGHGGPAHATSTSALNLNGADWVASHNVVTGSPQAVEMGSRRGVLVDNVFIGTGVDGSPKIAVNVGSTGSGIWRNLIARNRIVDFATGVGVSNVLGTVSRTTILNNDFTNASVDVRSGLDANSVNEGEIDAVVHGTSIVKGNRFRYEGRPALMAIEIGALDDPQAGLENVIVANNTVTFEKTYIDSGPNVNAPCRSDDAHGTCRIPAGFVALTGPYGGGARWRPATRYAVNDRAVPTVGNGRHYVCVTAGTSGATEPSFPAGDSATIADGTVVWKDAGPRPTVTLTDNTLTGPDRATGSGREIDLQNGTDRSAIQIRNLTANYPARIQHSAPGEIHELVPAKASYGDRARYGDTRPQAGVFAVGTRVTRPAPRAGTGGWIATRAGRAGLPWAAATRFAAGTYVVPLADNGHVYVQTSPATCTTGATAPAWPGGPAQDITDGTCTWREAGPSVRFEPF